MNVFHTKYTLNGLNYESSFDFIIKQISCIMVCLAKETNYKGYIKNKFTIIVLVIELVYRTANMSF